MSEVWTISYTQAALEDLQGIFEHICYTLQEPVTAQKQTDRILNIIDTLDQMPQRYRLYDKEPWRSRGLRVLAIDNYLAFYLTNEDLQTVTILRIMYGRRDINRHLN